MFPAMKKIKTRIDGSGEGRLCRSPMNALFRVVDSKRLPAPTQRGVGASLQH
jgi:hypothetical protein